eukprot:12171564-Heterocapsa_arctica.AAC.1
MSACFLGKASRSRERQQKAQEAPGTPISLYPLSLPSRLFSLCCSLFVISFRKGTVMVRESWAGGD